ncbi:hypothetical protein EIP91_011112 [Steccherinum ochraceum]|uniref:Aminoacyl-transfer RNA synthetases class-II family profile domain-containing protein n=1 Tax=Steccherinum ochraceum TaxID=92696 RepID=A0A4R0RRB8_9APHY|nr:hypothetical protein EIP91_011112 [Steccherinum ochraceum]
MYGFSPAATARILLPVIRRTTLRRTGTNLSIAARSIANSSFHRDEGVSRSSVTPPLPSRAHNAPYPTRTHNCGALRLEDAGSKVVLAGWLCPGRKAGKKLAFFPLKDANGITQLVVQARDNDSTLADIWEVPSESTVLIEGVVNARPQSQRRPVPAGDIEVQVTSFTLLNRADTELPIIPTDVFNVPNEELRLRYRYLDLRRAALSDNIRKRSQVSHIARTGLHEHGFDEVETPMLLKSSPEGAREFLVPTRSPQQPKQLLIASGAVDRYYQLARCFRDEDGRKDRQPEFTQIDLEMAWVSWGPPTPVSDSIPVDGFSREWRIGGTEVKDVIEALIRKIWHQVEGVTLPTLFPVMTYAEAMARYGSDKPDTRFGLEIQDVTKIFPEAVQAELLRRGELLEALVVKREEGSPFRVAADEIRQDMVEEGIEQMDLTRGGVADWMANSALLRELGVIHDNVTSNALLSAFGEGHRLWLTSRKRTAEGGSTPLGRHRLNVSAVAQQLGHLKFSPEPRFLWVTEFPLFTRADSDKDFLAHGRWSSSHHPFTAPMWEDIEKMYDGRINEVRGQHYDLVLNGVEIGGGSVRVHDASMQEYIFSKVLQPLQRLRLLITMLALLPQLTDDEKACFNHLLHALRCGAPPHGGIAIGFDRLMAILCKTESIRDVIAFPKTSAGTDLLFNSPAPASADVLQQYNIRPVGN